MKFIKMQGLGNDYVYIDCFKYNVHDPCNVAKVVSDRHFGIGSDGLILICPSEHADVRMDMYNLDGSRGEMCGNGARCVAKYVYDMGYVSKESFTMETMKKDVYITVHPKDGKADTITVDMGEALLTTDMQESICIDGFDTKFIGVDVGNPHAVYYIESKDKLDSLDLDKIGKGYECHPRFPNRVNSEFIVVEDKANLYMRVYERGSGETLACGTGACASAYATMRLGLCDSKVTMHLRGGELEISHDKNNNHIYMTGPAKIVFTGEIYIEGEDN